MKPPMIPVVRKMRISSEMTVPVRARCITSAMRNEPVRLTRSVPQGNAGPSSCAASAPTP